MCQSFQAIFRMQACKIVCFISIFRRLCASKINEIHFHFCEKYQLKKAATYIWFWHSFVKRFIILFRFKIVVFAQQFIVIFVVLFLSVILYQIVGKIIPFGGWNQIVFDSVVGNVHWHQGLVDLMVVVWGLCLKIVLRWRNVCGCHFCRILTFVAGIENVESVFSRSRWRR